MCVVRIWKVACPWPCFLASPVKRSEPTGRVVIFSARWLSHPSWPFDLWGCQSDAGSPVRRQLGSLSEASPACVYCWPGLGRRPGPYVGPGWSLFSPSFPESSCHLQAFQTEGLSSPADPGVTSWVGVSGTPLLWHICLEISKPGCVASPRWFWRLSGKSVPWASCVGTLAFLGIAHSEGVR